MEAKINLAVFSNFSCPKVNFLLANDKTLIILYSSQNEIYLWTRGNEKTAKLIFASTFRHHRHQLSPLVQNCLHEIFDNIPKVFYWIKSGEYGGHFSTFTFFPLSDILKLFLKNTLDHYQTSITNLHYYIFSFLAVSLLKSEWITPYPYFE